MSPPDILAPIAFVLVCVGLLVAGTQVSVPDPAVALASGGLVIAVVRAALSFRLVAEVTRLRHAQELARIGDVEVGEDGAMSCSPIMFDILGMAPSQLRTWPTFLELVHPDDRARVRHQERQARSAGTLDLTCRLVRPDGQRRFVHLVATTRASTDGIWQGWLGTLQDITEQERLRQERLRLLQRTVRSADDERQRLAEHLHDEAVQLLSAAILRLDLLGVDPDAAEPVHEPLAGAIASLRTTIAELAPPPVEPHSFEAAVRSYANRLFGSEAIEVHVDIRLDPDLKAPSIVMPTAYKVIQEALSNVRRHAQARNVWIAVTTDRENLRGAVVDDGVGIARQTFEQSSERSGHLGLRLMTERVEAAHGTLAIGIPDEGPGTRVAWTLPI